MGRVLIDVRTAMVRYGPATATATYSVLPPPITPIIKITVDKPTYNPGDKMTITGTITDADGITPLVGKTVSASDPNFAGAVPPQISDGAGKFTMVGIALLPVTILSSYSVVVSFAGDP